MRKYWILLRDYGYSEISVYGITARESMAQEWRAAHFDNSTAECELTLDLLPSEFLGLKGD